MCMQSGILPRRHRRTMCARVRLRLCRWVAELLSGRGFRFSAVCRKGIRDSSIKCGMEHVRRMYATPVVLSIRLERSATLVSRRMGRRLFDIRFLSCSQVRYPPPVSFVCSWQCGFSLCELLLLVNGAWSNWTDPTPIVCSATWYVPLRLI